MGIRLYIISDDHKQKIELGKDTPANVVAACDLAEKKRLEWNQKVCVYSLGATIPGRGCIYETRHIKYQTKRTGK